MTKSEILPTDPWYKCVSLSAFAEYKLSGCEVGPTPVKSAKSAFVDFIYRYIFGYWPISVVVVGVFSVWMYRKLWITRATSYCKCPSSLMSPTHRPRVLITGANSGIGKATALELLKKNCHVHMTCRNISDGMLAKEEILRAMPNQSQKNNDFLTIHLLDLTSVKSMQQLVSHFQSQSLTINILINNAGVFTSNLRRVAPTQFEESMAVNHLGHFLLTKLLLDSSLLQPWPVLSNGDSNVDPDNSMKTVSELLPRVIVVSSSLAKRGVLHPDEPDFNGKPPLTPKLAYANSKLANCLFARELHTRFHLQEARLNVYCLHTNGMINTGLFRRVIENLPFFVRPMARAMAWLLLKTPRDGCQSIVHCAISPQVNHESGYFYSNCQRVNQWPMSLKEKEADDMSRQLWDQSLQLWNSVLGSSTASED